MPTGENDLATKRLKGRTEGWRATLVQLLIKRFVPPPDWANQRLLHPTDDQLGIYIDSLRSNGQQSSIAEVWIRAGVLNRLRCVLRYRHLVRPRFQRGPTLTFHAWCLNSPLERARLLGMVDRLQTKVSLLREEVRIEDARFAHIPAQKRPHYPPPERFAILALKVQRA